jgi:hypothetical protein
MPYQGGGIQDVKFIPGNPESAALATAVHLGQVWIIYPFRKDSNGKQGVAEILYDLGPNARDVIAIYVSRTSFSFVSGLLWGKTSPRRLSRHYRRAVQLSNAGKLIPRKEH